MADSADPQQDDDSAGQTDPVVAEPTDPVVLDDWDQTGVCRAGRAFRDLSPGASTADEPIAAGTPRSSAVPAVVAVELVLEVPSQAPYRIRVLRGSQILLGRDPEFCEHTGYLSSYLSLSRRHVTLGLDDDGAAWLQDEYALNPVRVDFEDLAHGRRVEVLDGSGVQLCSGLAGMICLIKEEDT